MELATQDTNLNHNHEKFSFINRIYEETISTYDQGYELLCTGVCITTPKHHFAPSVCYNVIP